ncbi:MAG: transaldolase [Elainellaceae cyanobacterium]
MAANPLLTINEYGQSIWMDYLDRKFIESGDLKDLVENHGITGITSNPAIFQKAIANSDLYDGAMEKGAKAGKSVDEVYESIVCADIRDACDILRPVFERTEGQDGYVSLEVSPLLARDTKQGTIEEARRLHRMIDRDNLMIKIPGTPEGFPAIEQAIAEGISVNITLLFSVDSYIEAAQAYMRGLEKRIQEGKPIDRIASVASFFLSRIDTKVDDRIDERIKAIGTETLNEEARLAQMKGKVAIANAKIAYEKFQEMLASDRWKALADKGANIQRLLWASTSTKNPEYRDVMYIEELIGPNTINTLPPETISACEDHCDPKANTVEDKLSEAHNLIETLSSSDVQINLDEVMNELLEEGIDKFVQPFESLKQSLQNKMNRLSTAQAR